MRTDSGLLLADQGRTEWQIVTGYPAAPAECHAAQELQTCLQEITGACFPIQDDRTPAGSYEILIGNNRRLPDLSITPDQIQAGRRRLYHSDRRSLSGDCRRQPARHLVWRLQFPRDLSELPLVYADSQPDTQAQPAGDRGYPGCAGPCPSIPRCLCL